MLWKKVVLGKKSNPKIINFNNGVWDTNFEASAEKIQNFKFHWNVADSARRMNSNPGIWNIKTKVF
jgi:hypothetical protein